MSTQTRTLGLIAGIILLLSSPVHGQDVFIDTTATGGDCDPTYGTWDPINLTCTLSSDVFDTIRIDGDGITQGCTVLSVILDSWAKRIRGLGQMRCSPSSGQEKGKTKV